MHIVISAGSPSIEQPDYWWYRVRADLLRVSLDRYVKGSDVVLDVGSADGPSVAWLHDKGRRVALDVDPRGLVPGDVCGSAMELPFASNTFDVVAAFDVVEHCEDDHEALSEIHRVLVPGGRLLMSVPAYQWAWTQFDVQNQHHRRYTRGRAVAAVEGAGFELLRSTYMFAGTLPFFALDRLVTRFRERGGRGAPPPEPGGVPRLPDPGPLVTGILTGASRIDRRLLEKMDLPVGSSVVVAARKG